MSVKEEISAAVSRHAKRKRDNATRGRGWGMAGRGGAAFDTVMPVVMSVSCQFHSAVDRKKKNKVS